MLFKVTEFTDEDWEKHYKRIKKLLNKQGVKFIIKKTKTPQGLLHSIWAEEDNLNEVKKHVHNYYSKHPKYKLQKLQEKRFNKYYNNLSFRDYLTGIISNIKDKPVLSFALLVLILAILLEPIVRYLSH